VSRRASATEFLRVINRVREGGPVAAAPARVEALR
jgi:hypothetical protein